MTEQTLHHHRSRAVIGPPFNTVMYKLSAEWIETKREEKGRESREKEPRSPSK